VASYIIRRLVTMIPVFLGITVICFLVIHLPPGEPAALGSQMNPKVSAEAIQKMREYYGLDRPLHEQYLVWLGKFAALDFGESMSDGRPVREKIIERLPVTLLLNALALGLTLIIAIPVGIYSATHQKSRFDRAMTFFVFLGFAMPYFWLGMLLMILFGVKLGILPISGISSLDYDLLSGWGKAADRLRHLVMPVAIFTIGDLAYFSRYMRSSMLEVIRQDFIITARAKGLSERMVIYKHVLRNAMLSLITMLGLLIPAMIGGSVIIETLFALPGMGQLFYQAVMARDYPLIMGNLCFGALLTLIGNFIADISYSVADPRIRINTEKFSQN
jgi:peptide/nickel transport system permease protein